MTKAKRSLRAWWKRFGRFSSAVIVACFFLPFFGVSCAGMDMVTASGADMVGGCRPGGLLMEQKDKKGEDAMDAGGDIKIDNVDREPLAMIAMAACVALLALSFLSTRGALVGCFLLALAGLGSLGGLYAKVSKDIHGKMDDFGKADSKSGIGKEMMSDKDVDAGSRYGLWMVGLGLIGTAVVTAMAMRERDQSADGGG
ncbi:MAG: hypothetical protein JO257_08535 [Deltaproteobacteria bacterium]|nr:hypothetical protein [Deltaproteobacteria bacterium]